MKAVFHLDACEQKILGLALANIENLLKARPEAKARVLANGPAVKLFQAHEMPQAEQKRASALMEQGVEFLLCHNALMAFQVAESEVLPGCQVVPAGIPALIEAQEEGYAYIKP